MAKKVDENIIQEANNELVRAEGQRKAMVSFYRGEDKKDIRIPPMYQPHFGANMQVMVNGISIVVPVDGSMVTVPATFADEIAERMMKVDMIENKKAQMSRVSENLDMGSPGSLQMF